MKRVTYLFCLQPPEQFFSYPAAVTITGDWAANLGPCSALRGFEQGGVFIMLHLLRYGTSVYTVSSERAASTSHSGVRTLNSRIIRSFYARRSNHCAYINQCNSTNRNERTFSEQAHDTPRLPTISYW
jgi:hypothetical protein